MLVFYMMMVTIGILIQERERERERERESGRGKSSLKNLEHVYFIFDDDDERSTVSSVCVCAKMIEFCEKKKRKKKLDPKWMDYRKKKQTYGLIMNMRRIVWSLFFSS